MAALNEIDRAKPIPRHVAIIMDGNGRWAAAHKLESRLKGHEVGSESVRAVLRACQNVGVQYLTLYAFSTENWKRPPDEVKGLMELLRSFLLANTAELMERQVRLRVIGEHERLPAATRVVLEDVIARSAQNTGPTLILALSYGARQELVHAAQSIARAVQQGRLDPARIDEATLAAHLYAPDVPDPDLLIRTSGEQRLSNFLLWQLSYAELYVTPVLWPDFREQQFYDALVEYQRRIRRFGDI